MARVSESGVKRAGGFMRQAVGPGPSGHGAKPCGLRTLQSNMDAPRGGTRPTTNWDGGLGAIPKRQASRPTTEYGCAVWGHTAYNNKGGGSALCRQGTTRRPLGESERGYSWQDGAKPCGLRALQ